MSRLFASSGQSIGASGKPKYLAMLPKVERRLAWKTYIAEIKSSFIFTEIQFSPFTKNHRIGEN